MTSAKTTIRFWGGLRSIGGTVVTIEYNEARVIFDFGLTYNPASNIFDGQVKQRESALVRDYLQLKLIPPLDGVYPSASLVHNKEIIPAEKYNKETAVIISHLHLDHIGAMGLIDPSIPVYLSKEANQLYQVLEEIGEGVPGQREYQSCEYGKSFSIGEIEITPVQLDHDVLGACGYHIKTPDAAFVYTGDLRLHGKHPERTEAFIDEVKNLGIDVLIMEGTTIRSEEELPEEQLVANPEIPDDMITEKNTPEKMSQFLLETRGIGIFNIYHRNIDRIEGVIKAARKAGRHPVFEPQTAYLVDKLTNEREILIYESEETRTERAKGCLPQWKEAMMNKFQIVNADEINKKTAQYFVQNTYENVLELFDLDVSDGIYIHANGVPLGTFDPAYDNLQRILERLNVEYASIGNSGHAIPTHLKYIVDRIDPSILIPLHSFYPERLKPKSGAQLLPEYGITYTVKGSKVIPNKEE